MLEGVEGIGNSGLLLPQPDSYWVTQITQTEAKFHEWPNLNLQTRNIEPGLDNNWQI